MDEVGSFRSRQRLGSLVFCVSLVAILVNPARADNDPPTRVDDRFANEPKRPKAESPIPFSSSWDQASAEAKRTGAGCWLTLQVTTAVGAALWKSDRSPMRRSSS